MRPLVQALRQQGAPPAELELVSEFEGGVDALWRQCRQPLLMMRVAALAGVEPKISVRIASRATRAVIDYVGSSEPRPAHALFAAELWLDGKVEGEVCGKAGQMAEEVAQALRVQRKQAEKPLRRKYRAASYAAFAAARTALAARDASVVSEIDYDEKYTSDDAWAGAKIGCALAAGQVLIDAVEAAVSATAVEATEATGSALAGGAAANETRPTALAWACRIIRGEVPTPRIVEGTARILNG